LATAGRDPGSRAPAPGSLRLVQALVNTLNAELGRDLLGTAAEAIAEAGAAGTWPRLKSCPGQLCGWAFYDRSASARSRWCSMQVCGARSKMRAYRGRQPG
jgi:predicted RNA-binding Zn ribbon-like protein